MTTHQVVFLLVDIAVILVLTKVAGLLAQRLRQPPVIGEMAAGILLGPTLLGADLSRALFPSDTRPLLSALANIGVVVFMFLVGLELDPGLLRRDSGTALTVSLSSISLPFGLGVGLAFLVAGPGAPMPGFALFLGTAMAITAFPVLARILHDRGLRGTRLGGLALACAAVDDVAAWSILALTVATLGHHGDQWRLALIVPYLLVALLVVRPVLRRLAAQEPTVNTLVLVVAGLSLSAAATEWFGLHFIFGAFFFGVLMPRSGGRKLTKAIHVRLETFATALLLPVFFAVAGLDVDLSGLTGVGLGQLGLILLVAIVGKFGGGYAGARLRRETRRDAAILAILLNTRGLTELIVLAIGLQLKILNVQLYSLLVVMALTTTAMTGPLLSLLAYWKAGVPPGTQPGQPLSPPPGPSPGSPPGRSARLVSAPDRQHDDNDSGILKNQG